MRLSVDFSQWGGDLAPETIECWKGKGVSHAVVQYSDRMDQHIRALQAAGGIEIEAYVYLYWGLSPWNQTPLDRTKAALQRAAGRVSRLWLDCEDMSNAFRADQLAECADYLASEGMPTGIYTGRWYWEPYAGNNPDFAHLPLWHAEYLTTNLLAEPQKAAQVNFGAFQSYGGWTRPTLWQFQGTASLCGHSVDLNAIEDVVVAPAPPPPPAAELLNGPRKEGNFVVMYNDGVPVMRWGSTDGRYPGRISKLFGEEYLWLRCDDRLLAFWSRDEGD